MKIGFFGLGNMGLPMALNLKKGGHEVTAFDLSPEACDRARSSKLDVAGSAREAMEASEALITMLPTSEAMELFYVGGEDSALQRAREGTLFMDCSTISPTVSRRVAAAVASRRFEFVEAPVSGGTRAAAEATLTFLVGASGPGLEMATPLLNNMGKKIFHVGTAGAGQTAKICNNMLLAIHMIGTSEALLLGEANGLDPKLLSEILMASSGRNWSLEVYNPYPGVMPNVPASRDYEGGFPVELMEKDLRLAQEAALATRTNTPLGAMAHQLYEMHRKHGAPRLDFSSIIKFLIR